MRIENEPYGKAYSDLLDLAFSTCDKFSLVIQNDDDLELINALKVIEKLSPYFIECKKQCEWPGTISMGPVSVYYYSCDNNAKEFLKEISTCIFDWIPPDLPEDLTFYKNGDPWLVNTAHEFLCYLIPEGDEVNKILEIDGLEVSDLKYLP